MSTQQETKTKLQWWAYIHSHDRLIKLKRWMPPFPGQICDLEYCRQHEMGDGTFVLATTLKPFTADCIDEALWKAVHLFRAQGFKITETAKEKHCVGRASVGTNRFYLLDLD